MNANEALRLAKMVSALVPGTRIEQDTPAAWALVLDDVDFNDAQKALKDVYLNQGDDREFGQRRIEPDDIVREVKRIRAARIAAAPPYTPSRPGMTVLEETAELRDYNRSAADGNPVRRPALAGPRRTIPVLVKSINQ